MTTTRSHPVPCRGATLQESIRGTHKTWADDAFCEKCRRLNAQSVARVRAQLAAREAAPAAASRDDGRTVAETSTVLPTSPASPPGMPVGGSRTASRYPAPASSRGLPL